MDKAYAFTTVILLIFLIIVIWLLITQGFSSNIFLHISQVLLLIVLIIAFISFATLTIQSIIQDIKIKKILNKFK